MTDTQTIIQEVPPASPAATGIFGTKIPSSIAFAVGVLLFFMPFIDIKCNTVSLQKVSGAQLATGFDIKTPGTDNSLFGNLEHMADNEKKAEKKLEKKEANGYAMAAWGLGLLGLILSLVNARAGGIGGVITGILSAVAMIGLLVDVNQTIKSDIGSQGEGVVIRVDFTFWFFVTLIAFLAAAFFSYKRMGSK